MSFTNAISYHDIELDFDVAVKAKHPHNAYWKFREFCLKNAEFVRLEAELSSASNKMNLYELLPLDDTLTDNYREYRDSYYRFIAVEIHLMHKFLNSSIY